MSAHTPGPWKFGRWDQFGDARFYVSQQDGAPYTPNYSDVASLIAETVSSERVAIQEANARLIAAAPDLLSALEAALSAITDYLEYEHNGDPWTEDARAMGEMDIDDYQRDGRLESARAAIAKATGSAA